MIIDFHTHVFPPGVIAERDRYVMADATFNELYADPSKKLATADQLLSSMEEAGIDVSVLLAFAWSDPAHCREHNDYLLEAAAASRGRLIPFCTVQPRCEDGALMEIERCVRAGARGLGELRPANQGYDLEGREGELLARAALHYDLSLLFHVSEPVGHAYPGKRGLPLAAFYDFVQRWPDVKTVAAHWGGGLPFYSLMPSARPALSNTLFDTAASSLLYSSDIYGTGLKLAGAERVLFGSDFPLLSQTASRRQIEAAGLDPAHLPLVLGENARRRLQLP